MIDGCAEVIPIGPPADPGGVQRIPRSVDELDEPDLLEEQMLELADARVIFADHHRILGDFSGGGRQMAEPGPGAAPAEQQPWARAIGQWLLEHGAVISRRQAEQCLVNTPICVTDRESVAHRPPRYGRATVVTVPPPPVPVKSSCGDMDGGGARPGLLDLKGIGVGPERVPEARRHADGLLNLDWLLHELVNQLLIERLLRHAGTSVSVLPMYAAIDTGFEVRERWTGYGLLRPAAILVRRGHRRNRGNLELPLHGSVEQAALFKIELILRHYGMTSASPQSTLSLALQEDGRIAVMVAGEPADGGSEAHKRHYLALASDGASSVMLDGVNIQTTRGISLWPLRAELVDFTHFRVCDRYRSPLLSLVRDRPLRWGAVLTLDDPRYVQPDPLLRLPMERWRDEPIGEEIGALLGLPPGFVMRRDVAWLMSLSTRWRRRELSGPGVWAALRGFVDEVTAHLPIESRPAGPERAASP